MLTDFDFHLLQLRYIKAATEQIPTYQPDGLDAAGIEAVIISAKGGPEDYINAKMAVSISARGECVRRSRTATTRSSMCMPTMKSRYRKDPGSLQAIEALPVGDEPPPIPSNACSKPARSGPGSRRSAHPRKFSCPGRGWRRRTLTPCSKRSATKRPRSPATNQAFELAEGNLHDTNATMADLITAALTQGRAQFKSGAAREVIDAIPTEPASHEPNQPVISVSTSPGAGKVHLEFEAGHATSFDVLEKAPGAAGFTPVAEDSLLKTYDATGLTPGAYQYQIIGRNSLGDSPPSDPVTVNVG